MTAVFYVPGWEWTPNKTQQKKSTLEKKILLPLLPGLELTTFQSWAQCSTNKLTGLPWNPHLEVEAGHNGWLLHGQLFGGLLVAVAVAALDLGRVAQVLWPCESVSKQSRSIYDNNWTDTCIHLDFFFKDPTWTAYISSCVIPVSHASVILAVPGLQSIFERQLILEGFRGDLCIYTFFFIFHLFNEVHIALITCFCLFTVLTVNWASKLGHMPMVGWFAPL